MRLQLDQRVIIVNPEHVRGGVIYVVCGIHGNRVWLSVEDDTYPSNHLGDDGYSGVVLLASDESPDFQSLFRILMCDSRCGLFGDIRLSLV